VGKKRIIKKYDQLTPELFKLFKESYPDGYEDSLISFQTPTGELEFALPLETEEISYLIKMPKSTKADDDDDDIFESDSESAENFDNFDSLEIAEDSSDDD
jgi:hypothetical protein